MTGTALDAWAAGVLDRSEWFPRAGLDPRSVSVTDRLVVDGTELLWVAPRDPGASQIILAARRRDGGLELASASSVILALAGHGAVSTTAGGTVRWSGSSGSARFIAQVDATATNDVARVELGGDAALLKAYRVIGDGEPEERALAAAAGSVPRVLARVTYQSGAASDARLIALATESVPGRTLNVPLRLSLQHAWRIGDGSLGHDDLILIRRVRAAVRTLHRRLAGLGMPSRRPLDQRLTALMDDLGVVRDLVPAGPRRRLLDRAAGQAAALAAAGDYPAAPAHGDLHLSNVIAGDAAIRFIDLSGPSATMSPLDDFAALHRAVECMCLDLTVAAAAAETGIDQDEAAARLRAEALSPRPPDPDRGELARVGEEWSGSVIAHLVAPSGDPASELLYLGRLLHDLRYHTERVQTYYADLAWWHLARRLPGEAIR